MLFPHAREKERNFCEHTSANSVPSMIRNNQNVNVTHIYESLAKQPVHSKHTARAIQLSILRCIVQTVEIHVTPRINRKTIANPNASSYSVF